MEVAREEQWLLPKLPAPILSRWLDPRCVTLASLPWDSGTQWDTVGHTYLLLTIACFDESPLFGNFLPVTSELHNTGAVNVKACRW